jgi:hypothetical protein
MELYLFKVAALGLSWLLLKPQIPRMTLHGLARCKQPNGPRMFVGASLFVSPLS